MKTKSFHFLMLIHLLVLIVISCDINNTFDVENSLDNEYEVTFKNDTDFTLTVSHYDDYYEPFTINPGENKTVKTESTNITPTISGDTGHYSVSYKRDRTNYVLIQYRYYVEYKIEGTANAVDVTLNNPSGNTEQYTNVNIPHTYSYETFADWFLYISAQNQGTEGSVKVSIYLKGELFETATSEGEYVIATASGSK